MSSSWRPSIPSKDDKTFKIKLTYEIEVTAANKRDAICMAERDAEKLKLSDLDWKVIRKNNH